MSNVDIIQKLFSGSLLRVSVLVIHAGVAFFMMPFLVHNLGDRDYGLWVLVGTVMGYFGFLDFGLATAVGRFASKYYGERNYEEINRIVSTSFFIFLIAGIIALCLSIGGSLITDVFIYDTVEAKIFTVMMIIVGLSISSQFPMRALGGVATAMARYDAIAYIDIFKIIIRTTLIVYLISSGYGLIALAVITFIAETIGNIIQCIVTFRIASFLTIKWSFFHKEKVAKLFGYSWIAFIAGISDMMRIKILPILVAGLFRAEIVVIYAIALNLIEYFQQLIIQAVGIMMPVFSRFEGQEDSIRIIRSFKYVLTLNTIVATFIGSNMLFFGEPFILLWMGEKYGQSVEVLWLGGIPMTLLLSQIATRDLFFGLSVHRYIAAVNIAEVILICLFSVAFIPLGMIGVAYAFSIGVILPELIKPYLAAKVLKIRRMAVYRILLYTIIKSIAIIVPYFYAVQVWINLDSYVKMLVCGLIGTLYYGTIIFLFAISPDLKNVLIRTVSVPKHMKD